MATGESGRQNRFLLEKQLCPISVVLHLAFWLARHSWGLGWSLRGDGVDIESLIEVKFVIFDAFVHGGEIRTVRGLLQLLIVMFV